MGWSLSDLDPTNKKGKLRKKISSLDPTTSEGLTNIGLGPLAPFTELGLGKSPYDALNEGWNSAGDKVDQFANWAEDVGGSLFGGQSANQTITQVPWAGQQPYLRDLFSGASDLYKNGAPLYPELSDRTQTGIDTLFDRGVGGSVNENLANDTLGTMFGTVNPATSMFMPTAGGDMLNANPGNMIASDAMNRTGNNPAADYIGNWLNNGNLVDTQSQQLFGDTASGNFLNSNPYLDATYNKAADQVTKTFNNSIMPSINATFSNAGRTGSNAHMNVAKDQMSDLGGQLNNLATDIYGGNYARERGMMENAKNSLAGVNSQGINRNMQGAGMLGDIYNTDTSNMFTGANMIGNNYATERGNQMNAIGNMGNLFNTDFNNNLNAIGMVPTMSGLDYNNINAMIGAGGMVDDHNTKVAREPWERLSMYQGGVTGNYGGTTTQPSDKSNPLPALLGAGLGAWLAPTGSGVAGASLGAGLGGLLS